MPSSLAKKLYRSLSNHVGGSFLDDGSTHSVTSNVIAVVPSGPLNSSIRSIHVSNRKPTVEQGPQVPKDDKYPVVSFVIVYTMIFFNGCCFTAVVPSVPFYLQVLMAPPSFLGWVVSFYSLGQIFGSPLGGWMTSKLTSKNILTISSTIGFLSSTLYATAPVYMWILISRLFTGISAGMEFTTELTFIARNTTPQERTTFLASVTAVNVVGFIMGPALGTILATVDIEIFGLKIDQYTGPGWLLAGMFLVDLVMVRGWFQDHELVIDANSDDEHETEQTKLLGKEANGKTSSYGGTRDANNNCTSAKIFEGNKPPPSLSLVMTLIMVQFVIMCGFSVLETITSPLASDHFDWDVQACNLLFTGGGFVSLIAYVVFVVASRWVADRWLIVYALTLCFIGQILSIDWTSLSWAPRWMTTMMPPYLNRFLTGYMVMNAGFMTGRPVTFALYSKLIPSQYQGTYLGYMVAGGSAARTLGPFAAVALYYGVQTAGVNLLALFGSVGLFHLVCLLLVVWQWPRLLPVNPQLDSDKYDSEGETHSNGSTSSIDV
mmetsp:Transcript_1035/g.2079  ORF Transcript_1035/g.2079 Transcript_1035/m.2079 type:complete len:547 (+) Transcript_1035:232-1872(+)